MESDKVFIPSLYLRGAVETREQLYGDFSPEEEMTRRGAQPLSSGLREILGIKGFKSGSAMRVTDIDAYRSCPRRYFIEKVLGIEPKEITEFEVDPRTIGIILHEVMEKLIGPPIAGSEAFRKRAERVIDKVLEGRDLDDYFKSLIKASFLTVLPDIFEIEEGLASERYNPDRSEYAIKGEPLPGIKLKGKIDRIDVRDGGSALVLDYKTGSANLSSTGVIKRGETLQPFIYSALLKAEGARVPESVGIYSLKDLRIKRVPDRRDVKEGRTLEHFIETALLYLDSAVSGMRDGNYKAAPLNDGNCRQCHERPYCPYIQGDAK
jgi:RecB family exonuclease